MKTSCFAIALLSSILIQARADTAGTGAQTTANIVDLPAPTAYNVVDQGANQRVWERYTYEMSPSGNIVPKKHQYTELATGMNYLQNGQWVQSKEEIDILPQGGAAATQGQHQIYFPGDIYQGTIQMMTPDGKQLQSQPYGLFYDDGNNTIMIAELTNSVGQLVGSNQIIYPNAFTHIRADLLYTYTRDGFEQDIILRQQPPAPGALGLNPQTTRLQVLTEFFGAPQPNVTTTTVPTEAGDLTDQALDFGAMKMVPGKAFLLGANSPLVGVNKQWMVLQGRQFLVEEVSVASVADQLETLPLTSMRTSPRTFLLASSKQVILHPRRSVKTTHVPMLMAKGPLPSQGLVLDYQTINGSLTNIIFQSDSTYYISGAVNLYGTNTFEGNSVIKFARNASLNLYANPNWNSGPYRPVLFTAIDDNTVAESITGSTGSPTGYYANPALNFSGVSDNLSYFRVSYAQQAVEISDNGASSITNAQFVSCANGIEPINDTLTLENALFINVLTNFNGLNNSTVNAQNVTVNKSACLASLTGGSGTVNMTNGILAGVTNLSSTNILTMAGDHNGFYNSPVFGVNTFTNTFNPFQVVGAGSCYLTNGDAFLDVGVTNIDPALLTGLKTRTSFPPIVYSGAVFSVATNFSPQAQLDTNVPNLGYHYDPLDYVFSGVEIQSNMTFTAGTAVGWFDNQSGPGYGIILDQGVTAAFNGTATSPCWLARYDAVQEGGNGNWTITGYLAGITAQNLNSVYTPDAPQLVMQFTKGSSRNYNDSIYRDYSGYFVVRANNCEFYGGNGGYDISINLTNCLFFRFPPGVTCDCSASLSMANCTVEGGNLNALTIQHWSGTTWPVSIFNSAFDGTTISADTNGLACNYNSYLTNANLLPKVGAHDLTNILHYRWQSSWFGNYYLPTNSPLINAGKTNANLIGLYHFTTQTNQVKEANSLVDIGYHYVAADDYGNPRDTNVDGIPDYLEDANGNGVPDNGETNWALTILVQPTNLLVNVGDSPSLSVTAVGVTPIQYQWYSNSVLLVGATTSTLTLNNAQTNYSANYFVIVANFVGSLTSSTARLTVQLLPTISITNPANYSVIIASQTNVTLKATAADYPATITQVQFFAGTTSLGIDTNPPYTLVWSNVTAGNYGLTAIATDNSNHIATSSVVNITITPLFTTNTMRLWLKAGQIVGLTNNGAVTNWPDRSGWGNDATQGTVANGPRFVTNTINGFPIVRFNSTNNQYFTLPNYMNGATGAEAFVVLKVAVDPPSAPCGLWYNANSYSPWEKYPDTDGSISETFGNSSSSYFALGVPAQPLTQYHLYEVASQANYWAAWINGVLLYQTTINTVGFYSSPTLGKGYYQFNGDIAEVLVFSRALTPSERMTVNVYLNGKYALGPAVPATPSNLVATAVSQTQVGLTWDEPLNGGATQISIERSTNGSSGFAEVARVANSLSYVDTNLTAGTTYYYQVRAINVGTWSPYSNEANTTTLAAGADIPLGNLNLWLKADCGLAQIGSNTPVGLWADQSGNSNNATQYATNQPLWVSGVIGDRPVVRFNSTNGQYFTLPNYMNGATGAEAFVVLKVAVDPPPSGQVLWYNGGYNNGACAEAYPYIDRSISENFGSSTGPHSLGVPAQPLTQYHLYEVVSQTNYWAAWINGMLLYQTTINTVGFDSSPTLGYACHSYFGGDIAEVLVFNRALTPSERIAVNIYLNGKYALVPAVPATPSNLVATAISQTQVGLTWDEPLNGGATQISIERSTNSIGGFVAVAQIADALSYVDTNLTAGTTYYYQVRAINVNTWSPYSNETNTTTLAAGADIPLGNLNLWLKADCGLAQIGSNTPVGLWADQSGNSNNATQYATNQPLWVSGVIGDRPVVRFNSTNGQYFTLPNYMNGATGAEAFVVLKVAVDPPPSGQVLWYNGGYNNGACAEAYPYIDRSISENFGSSTGPHSLGVPAQPLTQYHLYEVSSQANNWAAWINGFLLYLTTNNTVGFDSSPTLGYACHSYFGGDIAEVLVFNRALTPSERDAVGLYLFSKYGLAQYSVNAVPPSAPTNLIAVGMAPYELNLPWTSTSTNAYSFHVERKLGSNGTYQVIGVVPSYTSHFVDVTASPNNTYSYRVKAHNLFGDSAGSTAISPPSINYTNWPATILVGQNNFITAQVTDAYGAVSNVSYFANQQLIGTATAFPYTVNWRNNREGPWSVTIFATDSLGNSQFSSPVTVTVYLDSNGDGIPDVTQVSSGIDPLNPWVAPPANTNDHTAPIITLMIPTNAVPVP